MGGLTKLAVIARACGHTATPGTKLPSGETIPCKTESKGNKQMAKNTISAAAFMEKVRPVVGALANCASQMTTENENLEAVHTVEAQLAAAELHINKLKELYAQHNVTRNGGSILM